MMTGALKPLVIRYLRLLASVARHRRVNAKISEHSRGWGTRRTPLERAG